MKHCLFLILLVGLTVFSSVRSQSCAANEEFTSCGNLCENSCCNNCDPSQFLNYYQAQNSPDCIPECYCLAGYIRNFAGDCVLHKPNTCGCEKNRCGKHAIYVRCHRGLEPPCFHRTVFASPAGFTGRCTCLPGYAMTINNRCKKTTSAACLAEATVPSMIQWLPTPQTC